MKGEEPIEREIMFMTERERKGGKKWMGKRGRKVEERERDGKRDSVHKLGQVSMIKEERKERNGRERNRRKREIICMT